MNQNGDKRTFKTGAQRDSKNHKGSYHLLSPFAIHALALRLQEGAEYYGERNFEKGMNLSELLDSGLRHMFQILAGDKSEDHAAAAMWNVMAFIHTREMISRGVLPNSLDDLPDYSVVKPAKKVPEEPVNVRHTEWVIERERKRLCDIAENSISSSVYALTKINRKTLYAYLQGRMSLITFMDWAMRNADVSVNEAMLKEHPGRSEKEIAIHIKGEIAAYVSERATRMLDHLDRLEGSEMGREEIEEQLTTIMRYE